jgi:hypothetical protein
MPPEDVLSITRITSKSLYHYTHGELINKLLLIQDFDGLDDEAQYAFRELQSSECVSSSTTYKDKTGNISSIIRTVKSHFASLIVTTKSEIYYDNMSRCIVTGINEDTDQTKKIIDYQNRKMSDSDFETNENNAKEFLQCCIRCLKNVEVINPFADKVKLPSEVKMSRRLNYHFQQFVKQITILHQYQRKRDSLDRLITAPDDIKIACDILFDSIMLKVDDLDSSLRQFFEKLKEYLRQIDTNGHMDYEFTQREIRLAFNQSRSACNNNLFELLRLEYIGRSGGHPNRGFKYKIIYRDDLEKLKLKIKQRLNDQLDFTQSLVASGCHLQKGNQKSRVTKEKTLVATDSENAHYKGGKK